MPLAAPALRAGAALLADLRLRVGQTPQPLTDLPPDCRPQTLADAYAMQTELRGLLAGRCGPAVGWKIGCTTPVMQAYLQIDHPCAGTLYRNTVYPGADTDSNVIRLRAADFFQLGLECELAVRLVTDLPGTPDGGAHSAASVAGAVGAVMTSVEIVEHRFKDFAAAATASLVADDFFSAGCVLGAERPLAELGDLTALSGGFAVDGMAGERGTGAAILGQPLNALAWLADHLAASGGRLRAGEVITLGSVVKTIYPSAGTAVEARFDGLEPVSLRIE